ncbi:MAG: hypothetical protein IKF19_02110 [Bacilli bacterium]|nr:hypothetical protein [Bacilli bacterium]
MMNNLIQRIKDNVKNIVEIRKLAQVKQISFDEARIMYNGGKNDIDFSDAKMINEVAKKYKVPYCVIQSMVLENGWSGNDIMLSDVHRRIYLDYVKSNNAEINEIGSWYDYVLKLHILVSYGIPIEAANKLIRFKIDLYAKIHKVSKKISTLVNVYDMPKEGAFKYCEVLDFHKNNKLDIFSKALNLRRYICMSDEFKKEIVNGILISSKTTEGLDRLRTVVNKAFKEGNDEYTNALREQADLNSLFVTDFCFRDRSCYFNFVHLIYMDNNKKTIDDELSTFYHETSHFLDDVGSSSYGVLYSETEEKVREIFEKIRVYITNSSIESIITNNKIPLCIRNFISKFNSEFDVSLNIKGFNLGFFSSIMIKKYIHNKELNMKWREEVDTEFCNYSEKYREAFFRQKLSQEAKKYKILINSVMDIYDGLSKGNLRSHFGISGHGKKYYSIKDNDLIEFIANIGSIYNYDGLDLLKYEFGPELSVEMIQIYKDMIKKGIVDDDINSKFVSNDGYVQIGDIKKATDNGNNIEKINFLKNLRSHLVGLKNSDELKDVDKEIKRSR